jgi:hypothetical protein
MKIITKLTSVNVIDNVYEKFRFLTINEDVNFQKLVNRSLDLYNQDENFRNKINNHDNLHISGSKY